MQQMQKRSMWLHKGSSDCLGLVLVLTLKVLYPRSFHRLGQTGMVGHPGKGEEVLFVAASR